MEVTQRLQILDGTYEVWVNLRENLVKYFLHYYERSAEVSSQRKM